MADIIGMLGTAMILLSYLLLQTGRLNAERWPYSALNGVGALLVLISLWYEFNLAAFVLELAWCLISAWGLYRTLVAARTADPG